MTVVCVLQAVLVGASAFSSSWQGRVSAGMLLLFAGIDMGILPMGRFIGAELPRKRSLALILGVGFSLGFATTAAEPDVLVLSSQVERTSEGAFRGQTLTYIVAGGPLANTFLLAMAFGAASALGQDPLTQGLGLVSLIALAPLVSVMALGLLVSRKQRRKES